VDAERLANVRAMACPFVIVELASHLADENDPHFSECVAALCAMWAHCKEELDGVTQLSTLADPETQLCESLYWQSPAQHLANIEALGDLVGQVYADPRPTALAALRPQFERVKQISVQSEERFVVVMNKMLARYDLTNAEVRKSVRQSLTSEEGRLEAGRHAVRRARLLLRKDGDDIEIDYRALAVCRACPAFVELYLYKLRQIACDGMNIAAPRQRNSVWDIDFSLRIGQTLNGLPLQLVTTDKDIVRSARETGHEGAVETLDGYLRRIQAIKS
jgi:hypothetical protein